VPLPFKGGHGGGLQKLPQKNYRMSLKAVEGAGEMSLSPTSFTHLKAGSTIRLRTPPSDDTDSLRVAGGAEKSGEWVWATQTPCTTTPIGLPLQP